MPLKGITAEKWRNLPGFIDPIADSHGCV